MYQSFSLTIFSGLVARENADLTEASLRVAEKLIRAKPDDLRDVGTLGGSFLKQAQLQLP